MIADASVLILFARIGRLDLLQRIGARFRVPAAVIDEVFVGGTGSADVQRVQQAIRAGWVAKEDVAGAEVGALVERFPRLGLGEAACLALALSLDRDETVLVDDADARAAARILDVPVTGSLGVLARLYEGGHLSKDELAHVVRALLAAGLWVSAEVVEGFWHALGGRP